MAGSVVMTIADVYNHSNFVIIMTTAKIAQTRRVVVS